MRTKLEQLLELQTLQFGPPDRTPEAQARMAELRSSLPEAMRASFERMALRGRKCLALVRSGVCSECHLQIPSGTLGNLGNEAIVHTCDNCGRYLYLSAEQKARGFGTPPPPSPPSAVPRKRTARTSRARAL